MSKKQSKRAIPLVDLAKYINGTAADKAAFIQEIGKAFHNTGFVGVVNHGISKTLIDDFYKFAKAPVNFEISFL
mgnify:CR=1 FL=1